MLGVSFSDARTRLGVESRQSVCVCVVYRARKCHAPRDEVGDVLRAVLGVRFSIARTKVGVESEQRESVLGVQSRKMRKKM